MGNQNQDRSNQTSTNAAEDSAANMQQAEAAAQAPTNGADDMLKLMEGNAKTCGVCPWMKCLRKPAISLQYTLEKRHIPDMDDDPTGKTQIKGSNSDTMSVSGGFTIRYLDLAAGAMALLLAGCMIKALCCVKRLM